MNRRRNLRIAAVLIILTIVTIAALPAVLPPAEGAGTLAVPGTKAYAIATSTSGALSSTLAAAAASVAEPLSRSGAFTLRGNFAVAGTGMRSKGYGTIAIEGIPGDATVERAYLYWTVLNPTAPPATGSFGESEIGGTLIGSGIDPCWQGLPSVGGTPVDAAAAWTFRADVTELVGSPGNGAYGLSGFPSGDSDGSDPFLNPTMGLLPLLEGASLVIIYSSPSEPPRDIVIYDGGASLPDSEGGDTATLALSGFRVSPDGDPSARLAFLGADGQSGAGPDNVFNGTILTALGDDPWNGSDGFVWDTDVYDVGSLLEPGATSATVAVQERGDCVVWTTAVLAVNAADTHPPVCDSTTTGTGATTVIVGSATDDAPGDSGIASVILDPLSTNLLLSVGGEGGFEPGQSSVEFFLSLESPGLGGSGSAIVTDLSGKTCRVGAAFTAISEGTVSNEPLFVDRGQGVKLFAEAGNATTSDVAVVDASPPGPDDAACLPACFDFASRALVLTVESPIDGLTNVSYDIDIPYDPNLRLLYRHPDAVDSCPYTDITTAVQDIAFDPRLKGGSSWSRVQFVAGRQIASCTPDTVGDRDNDGFSAGPGVDPAVADCDDFNPRIKPTATEVCNGIDDNCDGAVDDLPPLTCGTGACQKTVPSCVGGVPQTCTPGTPTAEICGDGIDNDCDGAVDETLLTSGYLQPVNKDGSSIFTRRRNTTIPFKFRLTNCQGASVPDAVATIDIALVTNGITGTEIETVASSGQANAGNLYRFDPGSNQYIYNLNASSLGSSGTFRVTTTVKNNAAAPTETLTFDVLISIQ